MLARSPQPVKGAYVFERVFASLSHTPWSRYTIIKIMHVYFSGIGGTGIGPLALIAKQAGYEVSGSDKQPSQYIEYLKKQGLGSITVGQSREGIAAVHTRQPIDWFVYSSALPKENPDHPELVFCRQNHIKTTKRDELLNEILSQKRLKLIAIAGTHGKTTTTAMIVWLFQQLRVPLSYSVGAKINFGDMGRFDPQSQYFVYECDEFDRNFLAFHPYFTTITGISWDHHEIFPTRQDYLDAFRQFLAQSIWRTLWRKDQELLGLSSDRHMVVLDENDPQINKLKLAGWYNRADGWQAVQAVHELSQAPLNQLIKHINRFPGVSRRFEKITDNLYTDYAHTPEKIAGVMSVAKETAGKNRQKIVIIYEPLTNRRMHFMRDQHQHVFSGASAIYWVPSYLAREDPNQPVLTPAELIKNLDPGQQAIAKPMELDDKLKLAISQHLQAGDLVVALSGGGGGSLDEWLRRNFKL